MQYLRFAAAFVVYTVIDVGWNVSPLARGMYDSLYEASGNDVLLDTFGREMEMWGGGPGPRPARVPVADCTRQQLPGD